MIWGKWLGGEFVLKDWIYEKLVSIRDKKAHDVLQLKWQRAKLEKQLEELKARRDSGDIQRAK